MDIENEKAKLFDEYFRMCSRPMDATDSGFVDFLVTKLADGGEGQAIVKAMKQIEYDLRLNYSGKDAWLHWVPGLNEWMVSQRKYQARRTTTLYCGPDEAAAVKALVEA